VKERSVSDFSSVTVVGCGVIGLSAGIRLLEAGFPVTIVARDLPPATTSNAAAAIWYIYAVHPLERAQQWALTSLAVYRDLYAVADSGISKVIVRDVAVTVTSELWWQGLIDEVEPVPLDQLPDGYAQGYDITIPLIETPLYMPFLMQRFQTLGGVIEQRELTSLESLYADGRLIVNCSGAWARDLANDPEVYPIQGQLVYVEAPGITRGYMDEHHPTLPTYIIPRHDAVILGGTSYPDRWGLEPDADEGRHIMMRCAEVEPSLRHARMVGQSVGLRPGRKEVRLEFEQVTPRCAVIHNYGHGGAGFTLSWGCADEVVGIAKGSTE
jgi:D-amino-acid oxidase